MWRKSYVPNFEDVNAFGDDMDKDDIVGLKIKSSKEVSSKSFNVKKPKVKGPMDIFCTPSAEKILQDRKRMKQTTMNEICKKELRDKACRDIAKWMYDATIPFNAVN